MAIRDTATYEFAPKVARVIVNNPDGSYPSAALLLSDVGPFDFSTAAVPAAVTVKIKVDNAAEISETLDFSGVAAIGAVTVAEFVAAWNTDAGTATGVTASAGALTQAGRVKLTKTTLGTAKYMQFYGEAATLAGFGYGNGAIIAKINTQKSVADAPTNKDSERLAITDANGKDTAVITDGYRTGANYTLVDTALDQALRAIIEGGTFAAGVYTAPTSSSRKPTFTLEVFSSKYSKDDNLEANLVGYLQKVSKSCKGTFGDRAGDRNLQARTYNISATGYRDPATLVRYSDTIETDLTVADYELLDVLNV